MSNPNIFLIKCQYICCKCPFTTVSLTSRANLWGWFLGLPASQWGPSAHWSLCCVKAPWQQTERCCLLLGQQAGEATVVCSVRRLLDAGDQTLKKDKKRAKISETCTTYTLLILLKLFGRKKAVCLHPHTHIPKFKNLRKRGFAHPWCSE